ncbi:MAG: hypothetical protein LBI78_01460 [Campylobacteraceae bacterium]|nr:hypothetical protein [Campylobacteraceae bacterium]
MKISIIMKALVVIMFGGFLFLGCGGNDGSLCYGSGCSSTGGGDGTGGGTGGDGGGDTGGDGDDNSTEGDDDTINAHLVFSSTEDNITDYRGMFNLVADNQVEPEQFDNHSTEYAKEIIYYNVDAGIVSRLYAFLDGTVYPGTKCNYIGEDNPPFCQYFRRDYFTLPLAIQMEGIYSTVIVFNQKETTGCAEDSGVCDLTILVYADPKYHNNTNPISLPSFKEAITGNYFDGSGMESVLFDIERNATTVSTSTYTWYHNMNLSTYMDVNFTIRLYTDHLPINNGSIKSLPQIPMQKSGDNGEGATLTYNGAHYSLENVYGEFASKPIQYDVNETDASGSNYWIADKGNFDYFSYVTLCRRTANATNATAEANATNATYTCEEGHGNISAHWTIQGKSVDLGW